jgi:4-carboxymuconolactone decarboxylase
MDYCRILRMLAVRDDMFFELVGPDESENVLVSQLTCEQAALARFGALIALDAPPSSYMHVAEFALSAGVTAEELVGILVAVIPVVGGDRAVSAAHKVGLAVGYDVDAALEDPNH